MPRDNLISQKVFLGRIQNLADIGLVHKRKWGKRNVVVAAGFIYKLDPAAAE